MEGGEGLEGRQEKREEACIGGMEAEREVRREGGRKGGWKGGWEGGKGRER